MRITVEGPRNHATQTNTFNETKGDKVIVSGDNPSVRANALGTSATSMGSTLLESNDFSANAELANELRLLKEEMQRLADHPEHDVAISEIEAAEKAAEAGDEKGLFFHLKKAGGWALEVAKKTAINLATKAILDAVGTSTSP